MIALTKEKREELAKYAKERLASHVIHCGCSDEEEILKIALASLTAETIGWGLRRTDGDRGYGNWLTSSPRKQDYLDYQPHAYENVPLYAAPPVPEIKIPNELMDLVKAVEFYHTVKAENPEVEIGAWNDAYDWIKKAAVEAAPLIKRLNGLGE